MDKILRTIQALNEMENAANNLMTICVAALVVLAVLFVVNEIVLAIRKK